MAELTYLDFDLSIVRAAEGYLAKGRDSHGREAEADFRMPFSESKREDFWRRIGLPGPQARRHAAAADAADRQRRSDRTLPVEATKSYGGSLFEALFHGELLICFRASLEEAERRDTGLRIRLRLTEVPELADLPWEYLYDRNRDRFLALSARTPVVRYLELPDPLRPITVRPPLKMLVMIASPVDKPELDAEGEWRQLNDALSDLQNRGLVQLERLDGATRTALQRRLRRGDVHIFHYIGHGVFDDQARQGALVLEDASGRSRECPGEDLGVLLRDCTSLRLAVLNACEGARASRRNPFAGVAQTLIRQGIPSVIAVQAKIRDDVALAWAHELYSAVADGYPVDAALAEARKALSGRGNQEWGAPVLFLRAREGRIFDIELPRDSESEVVVSERASPRVTSRRIWAGVAAIVLVVAFFLVSGPWRESVTKEDPSSTEASHVATEPPEVVAEPLATEHDRLANRPATKAIGLDPAAGEPDSHEPSSDPGPGSSPAAPPEPQPTPPIASSWPRQQGMHRNPRDGQHYAWIPEGSFRFGCSPGDDHCEPDEKPARQQEIERGFWLGKTEVTVGAYKRFRDHPSKMPPAPSFNPDWQKEAQPMVNVSRAEAARFCEWAASRLPTEIEWEYAARAGERRALPPDLSEMAWFADRSSGRVHAVNQLEPNAFGLYDMLGNASEWVAAGPDPQEGILRGGSYLHAERYHRFSFRLAEAPSERNEMYGFRCLAEVGP